MAKYAPVSVDQLTEDLRALVNVMKSVDGFRISDVIKGDINAYASHVEAGRTQEAVAAARSALEAGRSILAAFLRNSVVDRRPEGQQERPAYFTREIGIRRDEEKYDEDIVAGLESKRKKLEEAVRMETNGSFAARVDAYNTVKKALDTADAEQKRRDQNRKEREAEQKKAKKLEEDAETRRRSQAAAVAQREAMLVRRKQEADKIRGLL